MTTDTPATLKALRDLVERATPGPWEVFTEIAGEISVVMHPLRREKDHFTYAQDSTHLTKQDAHLIAASRTVVPILLGMLEETLKSHVQFRFLVEAQRQGKIPIRCECGRPDPCPDRQSAERALQELSQVLERQKE